MTARLFQGGVRVDAFGPGNRALAYGDGLFETMRVHRGGIHWWHAHWSRLSAGAAVLGLVLPDAQHVLAQVESLFAGDDGVAKLLVMRSGEARGYAPAPSAAPTWMLSRHPLPEAHPALSLGWCRTRLALQPALAGIKHCNRLEQVLARGECAQAGVDEGLMCDMDGWVVCATSANVFVLRDGRWVTPPVDRCGVAGVCRAHLLPLLDAWEQRLSVADVEGADAILLCNAVRGILAVARLAGRGGFDLGVASMARQRLAGIHPAFALQQESA